MGLRDGDGWVFCNCGYRHWGLHGAAGLLMVRFDMGERVICLSAECRKVASRGRAALAPAGLLWAK